MPDGSDDSTRSLGPDDQPTEPIRRRVALKLIKLGMNSRQVVARFDAERQALALMDHPNIAKVFAGLSLWGPKTHNGRRIGS
jgi:serine/threonine protein kinase